MAKKSAKKTVEVSVIKEITVADKKYIKQNYAKLSADQLSKDTGLTVKQINDLISSPEMDDVNSPNAKPNLRRFQRIEKDGESLGIVMTGAQAALGDKSLQQGTKVDMKQRYGDDFHYVEMNPNNVK